MKAQPYDLIGDIHGQHHKLTVLLDHLGYQKHGATYRHPKGRKVIFLGDYIDRGPQIRETLHTVRGMVEAGEALAIMGNHEYNAVSYATPDGAGDFLRKHLEKNVKQHAATLAAFEGRDDEWAGWLDWMKRLPMFLDLGELRAVHACWNDTHVKKLHGASLLDGAFLHATARRGTEEFDAVEVLLKGPELHLPEGAVFLDKENTARNKVRVRWWNIIEGTDLGEIAMPEPLDIRHPLKPRHVRELTNYPADAPPVFFGHYWMPAHKPKAPLAPNIACLDYSGAFGDNPLVAYRWDGERTLKPEHYIHVHTRKGGRDE